jgi:flagellar motor switch protein FliM
MSNQILTQEEIDALLSAMEKGDVDIQQETKKDVEAVPYNLTSQNTMLRSQFSGLEEVYDKFARYLRDALSSALQRSIAVEFASTEMVNYQEFINAFSNPTSFNLFGMNPLIGSALLVIEPTLTFSLMDCMFGGDGKPTTQIREFTQIEHRMIQKFALDILTKFGEAWSSVYPIKITLKKTETKPEFEFAGNLHLAIPYLMLEPIKEKFSPKYLREKDRGHTWGAQLQELLKDTHVTIIAELGRTTQTVRDLLNLQVKDVLKLKAGPEDLISISVDQVCKYQGYPGIIKGNRAVEVVRKINTNGDKN